MIRGGGARWIAAAALLAGAGAAAQGPVLDSDRAALIAARRDAMEAEMRAAALRRAAARAGSEADHARAEAAALAQSVRAAGQDIVAARARIALVTDLQAEQRRRISAQQAPIVRLLGALQTMARRPAALAIAQPGSVDDLVHVRLLLADTLPVVAARTAGLRAELRRADLLRRDAEQARDGLLRSRVTFAARRRALVALERTSIRRAQRFADQAADEAQRALGLGAEARDIADQLQRQEDAETIRHALERLPTPPLRPDGKGALPLHAGTPRYRLAAAGRVVTGFGEVARSGIRARGLTVETQANAPVIAGAAGTVLYARPFRGYGGVVIIGHGGGWTTTITGLAGLSVAAGTDIRKGDVIGHAGAGRPQVTTELRRNGRPIDIVALAQAG